MIVYGGFTQYLKSIIYNLMLNYNIVDPFPQRGNPVERDSAPKSLSEIQRESAQRDAQKRSSSLIHNLVSIFK